MQPGIHWCSPLFSTGCSQKFIGAIQCPSTGCSQDLMGQNCKRRVHFIGTSLFLGFGHRRLIQRICSPWFSVYLIDIGHRRQFALICSPCFPVKKENKSAQMSSCAQCRTSHGEQFKQNQRLCPKSPEYSKKQGEQICEMPLLCPNPGIRGEAEFQQSGIPEACPAKRHHRSPSCTS